MSTTYISTIILGYKAKLNEVYVMEPRFNIKTGGPEDPVKVLDHYELRVGDTVVGTGKEPYQAEDDAPPVKSSTKSKLTKRKK
jgi:hypothetical protein